MVALVVSPTPTAITPAITFRFSRQIPARPLIASSALGRGDQIVWFMTNAIGADRYLTIAELIERWPIGRTKVYEIARAPGFPEALVLVRDRHGRPRSMGFLLSDIAAFEQRFRVPAGDLALDASQCESDDLQFEVAACLPPAKKAMPLRRAP